jgi:FkbM family methyltransferase
VPLPDPIRIDHEDASPSSLSADEVIEVKTDLGPILLQRDADLVTPYVLEHYTYARDVSDLLRRALRPGMTFVDAGANIGWFSVLASKLVGPEGRVFSVEPDEFNVRVLKANLIRHQATNATILPIAAWSERTDLTIRHNPEGGAGVAVATNEPGLDRIPAARLDESISGPVDYLKVDCELTDHLVVMGAEKLIRENPSMLITVEFSPQHDSHTGHTPAQILNIYKSLGLAPYKILEQRGLMAVTYEDVATAAPRDQITLFDFALSPALPERLRASWRPSLPRKYLMYRRSPLEWAGDLLDRVPERVRPKIRRRDRAGSI